MIAIKGGTIVDGTGRPGFAGDVIVDGDRIVDVLENGERGSAFAKATADKSGNGERGTYPPSEASPRSGCPSRGGNGVFYFVHSYYAEIVPETCGVSEYAGVKFTAMTKRGRFWACQFHPEKSGRVGLELLKEWLSC